VTPLSYWLAFHGSLVALLGVEYLLHRVFPDPRRKAIYATVLWVAATLGMAALLVRPYHALGAQQFLAGYVLEESLSVDNLFVFLLLFRLFAIPAVRQPKVLYWGVAGAVVLRGAFVAGGLGLLNRFHWIGYLFAAIILMAAIRLLKPEPTDPTANQTPRWITWLSTLQPISTDQSRFFTRESPSPGQPVRLMATVLFLALVAVELTDVIFALDSIPAVLSITRVPFLAYTSNIMAVMGLRSLYVLLADALSRLRFLHFGLAAVLAFAALKMLAADWIDISPLISLAIIAAMLGITITASLLAGRQPTATA
jgi:tellurite resistance protein TerC